MTLTCKKCGNPKDENEFPKQKDKKWGRGSWCYKCKRGAEKERYYKKISKLKI